MSDAEYQAILAIVNVLAPILDGLGAPDGSTVGSSMAVITTGNAAAVGNDAMTTISQSAAGSVSGDSYASATQRATVANLGLGLFDFKSPRGRRQSIDHRVIDVG